MSLYPQPRERVSHANRHCWSIYAEAQVVEAGRLDPSRKPFFPHSAVSLREHEHETGG